jgi:hypothetical protein
MNTELSNQFLYNYAYLELYTPTLLDTGIAIVAGLVILFALRMFLLMLYGFFAVRKDTRAIASKKNVLADLILMKDIQTEMEREIEQASLKATFQK